MSSRRITGYDRRLFIISLLTFLAALPLIFLGGLVTSKQAGLAVPDWPNSFGYNMWLFPPSRWIGGIFYEHTHRLQGTVVGLLAIVQAVLGWRDARAWARWINIASLLCICIQGVMGGLRVDLVNIQLAIAHGIFAQLVLCLLSFACLINTRWWHTRYFQQTNEYARPLIRAVSIVFGLVFGQLVLGALMRHLGAGLAVPGVLIYGSLIPPVSENGLLAANASRLSLHDVSLPPVALYQIWLHYLHRLGAICVTLGICWLWRRTRTWAGCYIVVRLLSNLILALLATQITLGIATVYWRKPADITTLHHTTGAILLTTLGLLLAVCCRLFAARPMPSSAGFASKNPAFA